MADIKARVAEQFDTMEQQHESSWLGMWTFLATEILFFGGLFMAYLVYRNTYPQSFELASHHTNILYGTINTAVLLTSSLTMALAVHAAQEGHDKALVRFLQATILLALVFMVVKGAEYAEHFRHHEVPGKSFHAEPGAPHTELFYLLYFAMTGLHALHVLIGIGLLSVMAWLASKRLYGPAYHTPVELAGVYWHFVDIVWIFLYPLIYLIGGHRP